MRKHFVKILKIITKKNKQQVTTCIVNAGLRLNLKVGLYQEI